MVAAYEELKAKELLEVSKGAEVVNLEVVHM